MAKLADAADLKSADLNRLWGFKSPSRHHLDLSAAPVTSASKEYLYGRDACRSCPTPRGLARMIRANLELHEAVVGRVWFGAEGVRVPIYRRLLVLSVKELRVKR
jgi:hypothetical protein